MKIVHEDFFKGYKYKPKKRLDEDTSKQDEKLRALDNGVSIIKKRKKSKGSKNPKAKVKAVKKTKATVGTSEQATAQPLPPSQSSFAFISDASIFNVSSTEIHGPLTSTVEPLFPTSPAAQFNFVPEDPQELIGHQA
ncbi:hypothetical protein H0H87_001146, partial [Tephrocybe sp. NHM501043]